MSTDQLIFDTTDANTIDASANVGAYVRSSDGTLITHTTNGGDEGLDVNIINAADIEVGVNSEFAEDSAHTTGDIGSQVLAVRQDTLASSTSADGDYASFKVNTTGELYTKDSDAKSVLDTIDTVLDNIYIDTQAMVVDLAAIETEQLAQGITLDTIAGDTTSIDSTMTGLSQAEDSAHVSGDAGIQSLAVRNDTLSTLADTDGDYAPFQVDASGALYTYLTGSDPLTVNDAALAEGAIGSKADTLGAAATAENVVGTNQASRKYLFVYNNDNRKVYIGGSGVDKDNGFPVSPGSYMELRAGSSMNVFYDSEKTGHAIRTLEMS